MTKVYKHRATWNSEEKSRRYYEYAQAMKGIAMEIIEDANAWENLATGIKYRHYKVDYDEDTEELFERSTRYSDDIETATLRFEKEELEETGFCKK